ncbi:hypothetical protein [Flavobacterium sp. RSSB_23]|uniref:hypothetical protein n=1 Tax=Flavobacterium sp. RSSB_23 TaxID=3447668 RepID=UPI003F2CED0E
MEFEIAIVSALSALLGVALTMYFTNQREKSKFILDLKIKENDEIKSFYIDLIASLEKVQRYTKRGKDYSELIDEGSILSSKANLISPKHINEKLANVSEELYIWSSYYRKSLPTKIGDTDLSIISTEQEKFRKKADEFYPNLKKEIGELIQLIKSELEKNDNRIRK